MNPRWSLHRDEHCLRGLKFQYRLMDSWCAACFAQAITAAFPGRVLTGTEELGPVVVHRLLVPMGFELRWGLRPDELEVHHRVLASPETRSATHRAVERALDNLIGIRCSTHGALAGAPPRLSAATPD